MRRLALILLVLSLRGSPAMAQCEGPKASEGLQWGLGLQSLFPGNQPDFNKLVSPGYLLTGGYRWGRSSVYVTTQYASSTGFLMYSFEGSFRQILETPFLDLF